MALPCATVDLISSVAISTRVGCDRLLCHSRYGTPHQYHLTTQVLRSLLAGFRDTETLGLRSGPSIYVPFWPAAMAGSCVYPPGQNGAFTTKP